MKKLLSTAAAAVIAMGTAASAATLSIVGGSAGVIPGAAESNLVLDRIFGAPNSTLPGFYGSSIEVSGFSAGDNILVEYMGVEAGFTNSFALNGSTLFSKSGYESVDDAALNLDSTVAALTGNGLLDFSFTTSNANQTVANGDANLQSDPVNFFAANGPGGIWLFFDDDGSNQDDNHDDLVIRISSVPLPAGALLLLTGVGALALRRRTA